MVGIMNLSIFLNWITNNAQLEIGNPKSGLKKTKPQKPHLSLKH